MKHRALACLFAAVAAIGIVTTAGTAEARHRRVASSGRLDKTEDTYLGGKHFRIKSDAGAIHVWAPPGYDRAHAGTVIYIHGYGDSADSAWANHGLAKQFLASGQDALFIVPEAPSGNGQDVQWEALTDLRKAVHRANIKLPDGPIIVMGHSGAFRTMMKWVDHKLVAQVILLDAMYGGQDAFDEFIKSGKRARDHKLIMIGSDTASESTEFVRQYPFAVARDSMPGSVADFSKRERKAKLLYIKTQLGHMAIVTSGKVIPLLLRLTPLKRL